MSIIAYNRDFVQVGIVNPTDNSQTFANNRRIFEKKRTTSQSVAYELFDLGFNVFPQPIAHKGGFAWKRLQYTRLDRNHASYGIGTLFAGDCNLAIMCGRTSGNLFVIDCESLESLEYHMTQLRARGLPLWVSMTGRGGHIYLRATNGEVHNIEPFILKDAEIKGQNGYVLAPPSIHPTGAQYQWLMREGKEPPSIHTNQVDWLQTTQEQHVKLDVDTTTENITYGKWSYPVISPQSKLSKATREYILNGYQIAEGSRNKRLFVAACDMNGCGYSQSDCEAQLMPPALGSGLPSYEAKRTIESAYSKQRSPSRPTQKIASDNYEWRYALLWATKYKWQGRTNATDRVVFLALIERYRLSQNNDNLFRGSIREIATLARIGTTTATKALERLEKKNLIAKIAPDKVSGASLWSFDKRIIERGKKIELNLSTLSIPPHWLRYSVSVFNSDIAERGALGHSVLFVYEYLQTQNQSLMPSEIADLLGISVNQVNYALAKLRVYDLIDRVASGWLTSGSATNDAIAQQAGTLGNGQKRRARFAQERSVYAGQLLFSSRFKREGKQFMRAVQHQREISQVLDDPLVQFAMELGAVPIVDGVRLR